MDASRWAWPATPTPLEIPNYQPPIPTGLCATRITLPESPAPWVTRYSLVPGRAPGLLRRRQAEAALAAGTRRRTRPVV